MLLFAKDGQRMYYCGTTDTEPYMYEREENSVISSIQNFWILKYMYVLFYSIIIIVYRIVLFFLWGGRLDYHCTPPSLIVDDRERERDIE
jgi:hypothetical protein